MLMAAPFTYIQACAYRGLGAGPEPGNEHEMKQKPDFGQDTYVGHDKLKGKVCCRHGSKQCAFKMLMQSAAPTLSCLALYRIWEQPCRCARKSMHLPVCVSSIVSRKRSQLL